MSTDNDILVKIIQEVGKDVPTYSPISNDDYSGYKFTVRGIVVKVWREYHEEYPEYLTYVRDIRLQADRVHSKQLFDIFSRHEETVITRQKREQEKQRQAALVDILSTLERAST